ncbi:MAG: MBL fold metallo-hydrolase [Verrucomicrobia bacterium]|nr:MBL fold metallo-hydrolase [Verrucomicrobiota bacterium]
MILTMHRGAHQIGGSCVELAAAAGERILLDIGMPLTRPDGRDWPCGMLARPSATLRREGVLPDIAGLYRGETPRFAAVILSHAHLDHYGLSHHVHPDIPVYGSPGTLAMLRASQLFVPDAVLPSDLRELPDEGVLTIGPFAVNGIPVDHVAPDSRALLVESDGRRLLYSGDLRAHGRRPELFDALPAAAGKVDVLVLEGTTVGQPCGSHGFANEIEVERRLAELLKKERGLVVVLASGQNIDRAVSVYRAARSAGRELVIDAYQAYVLMTLKEIRPDAPQFDSPGVRVKFVDYHVKKLKAAGLWGLACEMSRAAKVKTEQMSAEPGRFVYLARASGSTTLLLRALERSGLPKIVWSQWKGYLERGGAVPRFCEERGIGVEVIHSGGHAHPEDLVEMVRMIQPKLIVPIHTEAGSSFGDLFQNVEIVGDGESLAIA